MISVTEIHSKLLKFGGGVPGRLGKSSVFWQPRFDLIGDFFISQEILDKKI